MIDPPMHRDRHEHVDHRSRLRAGEPRIGHSDNLVNSIGKPERMSDYIWVPPKTPRPIIVRQHCHWLPRIAFDKQPSCNWPQSEGTEHALRNVLHMRLLRLLLRAVRQIDL